MRCGAIAGPAPTTNYAGTSPDRTLHPGAEGEPAPGPLLRHGRGAALGAPAVQASLQPDLDHRAARLPDTRPGPSRSDRRHAHGCMCADRCLRIVDRYRRPGRRGTPRRSRNEFARCGGPLRSWSFTEAKRLLTHYMLTFIGYIL